MRSAPTGLPGWFDIGGFILAAPARPPGMRACTRPLERQRPRQPGDAQRAQLRNHVRHYHTAAAPAPPRSGHSGFAAPGPFAATPSARYMFNGAQFSPVLPPPAQTPSHRCVSLRRLQATCGAMPPADTRPCVRTKKNRPPKGAVCLTTGRRRYRRRPGVTVA